MIRFVGFMFKKLIITIISSIMTLILTLKNNFYSRLQCGILLSGLYLDSNTIEVISTVSIFSKFGKLIFVNKILYNINKAKVININKSFKTEYYLTNKSRKSTHTLII